MVLMDKAANKDTESFFELAERFRAATDSEQVRALGEKLGRWVFGKIDN
jgi:hypothetical protein